jgi:hypothetical protein
MPSWSILPRIKPALLIVDSIQTTYLPELESSAGSVTQVRECASRLRELAKTPGIAVFLIGHVTKEGMIAGPRVLEHIVDTVLYLEGDRFQAYRLLRSVKNRFGATSEVGVFEMRSAAWSKCQPLRSFPGGAHDQHPRLGHCRDHGGHPPAPGRGPGPHQPHRRSATRAAPPTASISTACCSWSRSSPAGWGCAWASRMFSSTWWAGSRSASLPPTWPCRCHRFLHQRPAGARRYRPDR